MGLIMKYKLIASDMDGTLFDESYQISSENKDAIKRAIENGVFFVLSTGRPRQAVEKYIKELSLEAFPIIIFNGATVLIGDETIYNLTLDDNLSEMVVREGRRRNTDMVCWSNNRFYAERDCEYVQKYKNIPNIEPIFVDDLTKVKEITKIVWFNPPIVTAKYHKELSEKFKGQLNVLPSRVDFLEFFNKDCSKAVALDIIGKRLGIKPNEMIAIGDGFNDLAMLEFAGLGVAMENAPKEVKEKADLVTLSCKNNGVKALIDRFLV